MKSQEYLGISVMEIASIPSNKIIIRPSTDSVENNYKLDFARLLSELHHLAFHTKIGELSIGDASLEITWVTTPVVNQLYSANICIYVVCRFISDNESNVWNNITALDKSIKILFLNQRYDYREIIYEEYAKLVSKESASYQALVRHERMEMTTIPTVPCIYSYERIPESNLDLSAIVGVLAFCPDVVVHIQAIPTVFDSNELQYISDFVRNASYASKGVMTNEGSISFPQIDRPLDTYRYYEYQNNGALFLYNIVVHGPLDSVGAINSQLFGQLSSDPRYPVRFDVVDLPSDYFHTNNIVFQPWMIQSYLMRRINESTLGIGQYNISNNIRRLPMIMTATELSEVLRLPVGSDTTQSGLVVNESKRNISAYHDNVINSGDINIGHLNVSSNSMVGIKLNDFTKHMFVAGTPGSGKSSFCVGILDRLWHEYHIPFLVIEPAKNEYRSLIKSIPELQVFTPGKEQISPFIFNPFYPPKNVKLRSYKSTLKTAFGAAVSMSSPLDKIFEDTINNCYSEHHWLDTDTSDAGGELFNIEEFIKCFKKTFDSIGYTGDASNIGRAGIVRLRSLINLFDNYFSIPISDLLTKPTVIELAAIENAEQKSLMIALILLSVLSFINYNYEGNGQLKNVILLEEAHVLLDQEENKCSDSNPGLLAQSLVKRFLAESRSYGVGLIIADQSPRKVGLDIVALTDIKVIFRIVEGTDKQIIGNSMSMDDVQFSRLSKLRPGEAFLFFNKLDSPEEIKIDDYRSDGRIPVWISDDCLTQLTTYWKSRGEHLRPYPECNLQAMCKDECNIEKRIVAKDVANRLFIKYIGNSGDSSKLKFVSANLVNLIRIELNANILDKRLYYCIRMHFWRKILYCSNYRISKEVVWKYISG